MQISGNFLPVASNQSGNSLTQDALPGRPRATLDLSPDAERQGRQQTVEYVFRGDLFEDVVNDQRNQNNINQQIDPANREAISSYVETGNTGTSFDNERQGRFLDIFI